MWDLLWCKPSSPFQDSPLVKGWWVVSVNCYCKKQIPGHCCCLLLPWSTTEWGHVGSRQGMVILIVLQCVTTCSFCPSATLLCAGGVAFVYPSTQPSTSTRPRFLLNSCHCKPRIYEHILWTKCVNMKLCKPKLVIVVPKSLLGLIWCKPSSL